ncbi:phospholipase D family protein [Lentisalinibacter sediminis]|uniref:phospholipase D family protein n=1 Tax=Lentisalinibacter sediminis TaxID=2992237 RepID=UPI0038660000
MLSPNNRSVYTDALVPPTGFQLDAGVATSFSMDLTTLLSVPLQLVMQSTEDYRQLLEDPVTLYDSLRRATDRVRVFVQRGQIHAPSRDHRLYGLLEPMIRQTVAPRGGAFHPKLWLLRFKAEEGDEVAYRLMVPSKNLTADRAWDIAVTLEGVLGDRVLPINRDLTRLLESLGGADEEGADPAGAEVLGSILSEIGRIVWEVPDGFDSVRFRVLGLDRQTWRPRRNENLAVISPFVRPDALQALAESSDRPRFLISRANELSALGTAPPFEAIYTLHEAAETEETGDATEESPEAGLHAKVYLYQVGKRTHLVLGSANASDSALLLGRNVELLVELEGLSRRVGRVEDLLDPDDGRGLGKLLVHWRSEEAEPIDETARANERKLDAARKVLSASEMELACIPDGDQWRMALSTPEPIELEGIAEAVCWPVTIGQQHAVSMAPLFSGGAVTLPGQSLSSLTALVAFQLKAGGLRQAFVLRLPVTGMPEGRDRAILRYVVRDRKSFIRYLLLLLAGLGDSADVGDVARNFDRWDHWHSGDFEDMPLLEELVRAFARDPKRLKRIREIVEDLTSDQGGEDVLPAGFLSLWQVFEEAMVADGH